MVERRHFLSLLAAAPRAAFAAQAAMDFAVVAGTIFKDSGFALAGAEVTIEPETAPLKKVKKLKASSSPRGEFSFRVPPTAAKYRVSVSAKGFQASSKIVEVQGGGERADATFNLSPESKH